MRNRTSCSGPTILLDLYLANLFLSISAQPFLHIWNDFEQWPDACYHFAPYHSAIRDVRCCALNKLALLAISNMANSRHIPTSIRIHRFHFAISARHCQKIIARDNNVYPDLLHNSLGGPRESHEYYHQLSYNDAPWQKHSTTARADLRLAYCVTHIQNTLKNVVVSWAIVLVHLIHMYCTQTRAGSCTVRHCSTVITHAHTPGDVYMCMHMHQPGDAYMCTRHKCVPARGPCQLPITTMVDHSKPPKT